MKNIHIYIGDRIHSSHYTYETFKDIYKRRRDRFVDSIKSSKNILFCRFEANILNYTKEDIDDFIHSILYINPKLEDIKLLCITPKMDVEHPSLIKVLYDKHSSDPYCTSKEINDLFLKSLQTIGYNIEDTTDISFTDISEV